MFSTNEPLSQLTESPNHVFNRMKATCHEASIPTARTPKSSRLRKSRGIIDVPNSPKQWNYDAHEGISLMSKTSLTLDLSSRICSASKKICPLQEESFSRLFPFYTLFINPSPQRTNMSPILRKLSGNEKESKFIQI